MFDIFCVTNRSLCEGDFLSQVKKVAEGGADAVILREKDLPEQDYEALAKEVLKICQDAGTPCILHSFVSAAIRLDAKAIHLPLPVLRTMTAEEKAKFDSIGASCHSKEEAEEAERLGCTYITAGHVFVTDCKKGLAPRGLSFLQEVCEAVTLPVYAIGGINSENAQSAYEAGAKGVCLMSGFMRCRDVRKMVSEMRE